MSKYEEFEDRLRKAIRSDRERFDVPEGYFSDFKSRMMAQVKDEPVFQTHTEPEVIQVKVNWYVLPLMMAACLALFMVFKPGVKEEPKSLDTVLSEVSIVPTESTDLELDSQSIAAVAETALAEQYEYEVALEEVYEDDDMEEEDYLASLENVETEALEEFLIDNLNLYSEL
ncbi:MAG: hypothetical protein EP332_08445 [Bacteroidetes bacterium]|nr:MAG: hypothetical protein EP332_08445 [Bacteroidota bacterium]